MCLGIDLGRRVVLPPTALKPLDGSERLVRASTVLEFWRWALGDLRMNNAFAATSSSS